MGFLPVYKIAGAAAEEGQSLGQVLAIAERLERNMRTLSVAVRPATHPATGLELSSLGDDEMEIGAGQHGESGPGRMKLKSADETAEIMLDRLLEDLEARPGDELLVIMNGMGATTLMELFIVFRRVSQLLDAKGIKIARSLVGEYITAQEQAGFQMFIARLDRELLTALGCPLRCGVYGSALGRTAHLESMSALVGKPEFIAMLAGAIAKVRDGSDYLSQLDSAGGDGDHGVTMRRAMGEVEKTLAANQEASLRELIAQVGWTLLGIDGGATGPLLGSFFIGVAENVGERQALDVEGLAGAFEAGVAQRSEADEGTDRRQDDDRCPAARRRGVARRRERGQGC